MIKLVDRRANNVLFICTPQSNVQVQTYRRAQEFSKLLHAGVQRPPESNKNYQGGALNNKCWPPLVWYWGGVLGLSVIINFQEK